MGGVGHGKGPRSRVSGASVSRVGALGFQHRRWIGPAGGSGGAPSLHRAGHAGRSARVRPIGASWGRVPSIGRGRLEAVRGRLRGTDPRGVFRPVPACFRASFGSETALNSKIWGLGVFQTSRLRPLSYDIRPVSARYGIDTHKTLKRAVKRLRIAHLAARPFIGGQTKGPARIGGASIGCIWKRPARYRRGVFSSFCALD